MNPYGFENNPVREALNPPSRRRRRHPGAAREAPEGEEFFLHASSAATTPVVPPSDRTQRSAIQRLPRLRFTRDSALCEGSESYESGPGIGSTQPWPWYDRMNSQWPDDGPVPHLGRPVRRRSPQWSGVHATAHNNRRAPTVDHHGQDAHRTPKTPHDGQSRRNDLRFQGQYRSARRERGVDGTFRRDIRRPPIATSNYLSEDSRHFSTPCIILLINCESFLLIQKDGAARGAARDRLVP